MPKKNPLIGLTYSPTEFRPYGVVYAPGTKQRPAPMPNGRKVPTVGQKKTK